MCLCTEITFQDVPETFQSEPEHPEYADNSVEFLESSGISGRTGANVYSVQQGVLIFSMCAAATQSRTGDRTGPPNVPHRSSAQVSAQLRGVNS